MTLPSPAPPLNEIDAIALSERREAGSYESMAELFGE